MTGSGRDTNSVEPTAKPGNFFEVKPTSALAKKHTAFKSLSARIRQDPKYKKGLEEAGTWVAESFYGFDGETIRTVRLKKGLSQKQLAELVGTSQPYIANLEAKGSNRIALENCEKLSRALGVSLDDFSKMLRQQRELNERRHKK